jgi:microsomal dipeptidase-like Zn-dependent dipeptidase
MRIRQFLVFSALLIGIPKAEASRPVPGFADLHNHMFSEYAFGGAWIHGTTEGELAEALSPCDAHFDLFSTHGTHGEVKIPFISGLIGRSDGSPGDTGAHFLRSEGFPSFQDWPRWDSIAHQQVWGGHLKRAHDMGLTLLVVSMVNFEPLCELMVDKNKRFKDCSDTASLQLQLDAAKHFQQSHPWFQIVQSPSEARSAIEKGNLAVVLSLEASHIFGDGPWKPEFQTAYQNGVRTLQFVHQFNNRFGGAALHHPIFKLFFWLQDFKNHGNLIDLLSPTQFGFHYDHDSASGTDTNRSGLTDEGQEMVREMMKRGMPIDLAHLSEKSVNDVSKITLPVHYPVYVSHGHFRKAMNDGKFSLYEKSSSDSVLELIRKSEGIFGLRTGPEKTHSTPESGVPNDCQGSSKSFAQAYAYGRNHGISIAFGSDLNGFIKQTRPRFGGPRETCGAESEASLRTLQQKAQKQPVGTRFDQVGLGSVAELPDLLRDLKDEGLETQNLDHSAETYIRMWERALEVSKKL